MRTSERFGTIRCARLKALDEWENRPVQLSTRVLIGLGLGVLTGLFFGEMVGFLSFVGDAFVRLLQMTVLHWVD